MYRAKTLLFYISLLVVTFYFFNFFPINKAIDLQNKGYFHENYKTLGLEVFKPLGNFQTRRCRQVTGERIVFTFGSNFKYLDAARKACVATIKQNGVDSCYVANMDYIDKEFKNQNEDIFKNKRGTGKWIWKPYVILKFLDEKVHWNDMFFYMDADFRLVNPIDYVFCIQHGLKQDIAVFFQSELERTWTKGNTFVLMNLDQNKIERMANTIQVHAAFILFRKSAHSLRFIAEWLTYAQDGRILTGEARGEKFKPDYPDFQKHRNDQSIISLLSKRWRIPLWPTPRGDWKSTGPFPQDGKVIIPYNKFDITKFSIPWPVAKQFKIKITGYT